jgi:formamidopyrimidine-DNA glycosylase
MHYRAKESDEEETWPPKFWKFTLETEGKEKVEAAFADARRFGRVRLVDCPAEEIRNTTPLKENGPDPVIDKDVLTEEYLEKKMRSKHVPVKALLLDQANISGIGNYIGLGSR